MKLKYCLFILLLFVPFLGKAQYSRLFTSENDLSSSMINKIYQDSRGYIWIATGDGLNRYDGAKFAIYKTNRNDSTSLLSNDVYFVYEDSREHIYILSTRGLQLYDYDTDSFKTLYVTTLGYNNQCIIERKDGTILIGTSGYGIKTLEYGDDGTFSLNSWEDDKLGGYIVNDLFEDSEGNLWISTEFNGLVKMDTSGNKKCYSLGKNGRLSYINLCTQDDSGNIYAASSGLGVFMYDNETDSFVSVYETRYPVKVITQREGQMLFGTDGDGIVAYNIADNNISRTDLYINDIDLSSAKIHSLISDNYNNLWIGIYQKGVAFVPAQYNMFNYIGYRSTFKNSIGDKCVTSISRNDNGEFFVGTDNDGLYVLDSDYNQTKHLSRHAGSCNAPNIVLCMLNDSYGRLWVGSFLEGLAYWDKRKNMFSYLSFEAGGFRNIDRVFALTEDRFKRLWIGTMGGGIFYIDLAAPDMVKDTFVVNGKKVRPNDDLNWWINCLFYGVGDMLYIGTVDGIRCLDLSHGKYTLDVPVLEGDSISTISQDINGNIWVGTIDGIKVFDRFLGKIVAEYDTSNGLPGNNIASITSDRKGNIWISTNRGLAKYDFNSKKFTSFRISDGLYNNEFTRGAFYNDSDGRIYFGGTSGIVYFDPDEIKVEPINCNVRITAFYLHNVPVNKTTKSGKYNVLSREIIKETEVELANNDNSFTIEFAADNFSIPHDFEYSLNDGPWNRLQPGTSSVSFSNLPVGKYKFMVRNKNMTADSSARSLLIIIHPAWYASLWAKTIYCFIVICIISFVLYQVRLRYLANQEMLKHKLLEEANEAKLQFFINISHEIRTPMSLIISPLHKLISSDKDPDRQKKYSIIERNAERILSLINQLMDIRKIDKQQMKLRFSEVDLIGFIKDINDIFSYQAGLKGVRLNVISECERLNVWIDPNNFDKIILNLLSNSFKHVSGDGEINIYIKAGKDNNAQPPLDNFAEITVEDNGTGIKESEINHIFERFYQITDDKSYVSGTGIGLHLAMSLVRLHHGTISVKNNEDKPGCSFTIRIPLGNSHLEQDEMVDNKSGYMRKELHEIKPINIEETTVVDYNKKMVRKKYTLLIAEDDSEIMNYLVEELGNTYRIIQCNNGKEAYESIISNLPDIVLSDIMMPEMDGLTLLKKIRQNINVNHIPVVLLTAKNSESDNMAGLSSGADAYLAKPFNIDMVKVTIDNLLRNREVLKNNFNVNQEQKMNKTFIQAETSDERLMKKVMNAINNNISNPELNVEMIAAEVGISRVHLYRKLKELTNQSTRDFIRNTRLKQAEALLLSDKNYNVSEIALLVGFNNTTYFSNAFKELYGLSPSKYVEKHKGHKDGDDTI